jgi:hypothetical protein
MYRFTRTLWLDSESVVHSISTAFLAAKYRSVVCTERFGHDWRCVTSDPRIADVS